MTNNLIQCPYCGQPITSKEYERIKKEMKKESDEQLNKAKNEEKRKYIQKETKLIEDRTKFEKEKNDLTKLIDTQSKEMKTFKERVEREKQAAIKIELTRLKESQKLKEKLVLEEGKKAGRIESDIEKRKLQQSVEELKRQLEKKTSQELGSIPEEELAKRLSDAFREDKISRIKKGESGADIKHEINYKGVACGLIIYENKNTKDWLNSFIDRAKQYKTMYKTSSVIIVSVAFPKGQSNFYLKDGICIVHPSIVISLVEIIRGTLIRLHLAKLSKEESTNKMNEVYKYIAGDSFKVQMDSLFQMIEDLKKVQKDEQTKHNSVWSKQSELFDNLQKSAFSIKSKLDNIIDQTD